MEESVPKRQHMEFTRRGITQKKEYNVQNTEKVWNQNSPSFFSDKRKEGTHSVVRMYIVWVLHLMVKMVTIRL